MLWAKTPLELSSRPVPISAAMEEDGVVKDGAGMVNSPKIVRKSGAESIITKHKVNDSNSYFLSDKRASTVGEVQQQAIVLLLLFSYLLLLIR